ncbi:MAG: nucleotide sugar dehydrogenase [Desulfobaccales bacterium]
MTLCQTFADLSRNLGRKDPGVHRPVVCVQGLGFVGTAMALAVAQARDLAGLPMFNVIGVDLPNREGLAKIDAINRGILPFACEDPKLETAMRQAHQEGNLLATTEPAVYSLASVIMVDVNLDLVYEEGEPKVPLDGFREAIRTLGTYMPNGCLVIVETTVPPGTCTKLVAPLLAEAAVARGFPKDTFLLAHAYERVMPGKEYFDSIVRFWRVYAGYTEAAAEACEAFLSQVIDVKQFPLTRLGSTTASEIGKVLENSYRAVNIAFMEEWGRFAERLNIDLFEVVRAIRIRPTHSNMRQPGFGVGGYCLTKDPLMTAIAGLDLFGLTNLEFPFCQMAVTTNRAMPLVSLDKVQELLGGELKGKTLILLGVSYRQDIGDTRNSPSQTFVEQARLRSAQIICHDPYVSYWPEMDITLHSELPSPREAQAVVFAVPHEAYLNLDILAWLNGAQPLIFDANDVLTFRHIKDLKGAGIPVWRIGRGQET